MKTVAEIFEIAGISRFSVFETKSTCVMYEVGILTGLWYGNVITLNEYRAARSALQIVHYGMID